jgi:hypothetical protein
LLARRYASASAIIITHDATIVIITHDATIVIITHDTTIVIITHDTTIVIITHDATIVIITHDATIAIITHDTAPLPSRIASYSHRPGQIPNRAVPCKVCSHMSCEQMMMDVRDDDDDEG